MNSRVCRESKIQNSPINVPSRKITIFGAGQVGIACGVILLLRKIANHLVFIGNNKEELRAEMLDLKPYSMYYANAIIESTTSKYSKLYGSQICIIAAGVRILPGETKTDFLPRNIEVLRAYIPQILKHCPETIILVVTNPIDVMTYFAWKMSDFPANRVIGVGHLYSKAFQYQIAQHMGVSADILKAWIVGEYGDSGVSLWSGVHIAGTQIRDINKDFGMPEDVEKSFEVYKELLNIPHKTTVMKGYSSWAPGFCVAAIVNAILDNRNEIYSVSILAKGIGNIDKNIFLSLPCEIGSGGATRCVIPRFTADEEKRFEKSADVVEKKIKKCNFWTVNSSTIVTNDPNFL